MSQIRMSHGTHADGSCPTHTRVLSQVAVGHHNLISLTNSPLLWHSSHELASSSPTNIPHPWRSSHDLASPMAFVSRTGLLLSHKHTSSTALLSRTRPPLSALLLRTPCVTGGSGAPQSQKSHENDGKSFSAHTKVYMMMRCNLLQCAAVCCSILQYVAVRCSALQCVAVRCSVLQCVAVRCSALQCVTVRHSALQRSTPK